MTIALGVIVPIKHALPLLEVVGNMVYPFLPGREDRRAKPTPSRESRLGLYQAIRLVVGSRDRWVDVAEVLGEVIATIARLRAF
jgi:hypothetical protein